MNSILVAPTRRTLEGRVLAIEPDPSYVRRLRTLLQEQVALEIAASAENAIASIDRRLPDLVMTSAFLDPAETRKLTDHLKSLPSAAHVQVIITPHLIEHEIAPPTSWALSRRRLRARETRPYCDPEAFLRQIDEYLKQARAARQGQEPEEPAPVIVEHPEIRLVASTPSPERFETSIILSANESNDAGNDRRRATRQRREQLPWLRGAKLPWGNDLNIVDVSRTGVLAETTSRVSPGTTVDLQFLAEDANVTVPSRVLRTYVAKVDRLGVKYRVAAAFNRDLDLIENIEDDLIAPKALGEVLTRTLADADRLADPSVLRDRFEREVRRLVPVRSVRIRHEPAMANDGDDSVYFKVPAGSGFAVLQTTFERGRPPSPMEFKVLKAAANLAAVLLEFAPLDSGRQLRALA